jgi:hypothetical protein
VRHKERVLWSIVVTVFVLCGLLGQAWAENSDHRKTVMLRIHSFTMNPGEKVVGVMVAVSQGEIVFVAMPYGWRSQYSRTVDRKHHVHCFGAHSSYGINASGRMPVFTINPSSSKTLSIEASVEIESVDGKRHTRQIRDSELSVQ